MLWRGTRLVAAQGFRKAPQYATLVVAMKRFALFALLATAAPAQQPAPDAPPAPLEIVAKAPAADWVAIAPSDLLVIELAPDNAGKARRVVIQLVPAPFAGGWTGNIRKLAAARFWDGTSVNRVQDNYVAQWGDASEKKALPAGLATMTEGDYSAATPAAYDTMLRQIATRGFVPTNPVRLPPDYGDPYAEFAGFIAGFPIAGEMGADAGGRVWPVHCYGSVGVGRNMAPDTGSGAELYTVIGHAPRHLDRNIAVVGRVIEGIEHLSSLPRGTGNLGFYEKPEQRVAIRSVRLGSELPPGRDLKFQYLSTESDTFEAYANARANRRDPFFVRPAGGADICNVPVPVRRYP